MINDIFLFLSITFILILAIGLLLRKKHIPWIFSALIIGFMLAIYNPFIEITNSEMFNFLAEIGMYLLLFIIGFELDLKEMKTNGKFILLSSFIITILGALCLFPIFFFIFQLNFVISLILGLSFSTVGEAILIPILDQFKEVNTPLGQAIIGIGTLDDIIEIFTLIVVIMIVGGESAGHFNVFLVFLSLSIVFVLTIFFIKFKKTGTTFKLMQIDSLFFFILFALFLFIGLGNFAEAASLGALLAGISLRNFIPAERLENVQSNIKTMCYGFFAPLFFLWVGLQMDVFSLVLYPLSVLLVVGVSFGSKLLGSYLCGKGKLGKRESLILGIGLSVRFSTSLVIITILYSYNLIQKDLFSIIIASSMIFTFLIPIIFCNLLVHKQNNHPTHKIKVHPI